MNELQVELADETIQTDVIIIGAGPTGLALACQFVRAGIDLVIIEKSEGVTPYSKALGVHARTLEIYEQMGLAQQAVDRGTIASTARLLDGGKVRAELDLSNLGAGLTAYLYVLFCEQSKNEQLLYEYLQQNGKTVRWQTELISFLPTEEKVTAQVKSADGRSQTIPQSGGYAIEAKYLVGCDGPKSPVRHALGIEFAGSTFDRLFYVADVRLDGNLHHYDKLHQPKFHWLVFADARADVRSLKTELERQDLELVDFNILPLDPQVATAFGTSESFNVFLRPDNYIAFISAEISLDRVKTYLQKLTK